MSGQKQTKTDAFLLEIPIKFLEVSGRLVPLIGGGSGGDNPDSSGQNQPGNDQKPQDQSQPVDPQAILDEFARSLGFESADELQMKILELEGKQQEYIDKLRENYTKQITQLQKEAETYRKMYEETVIKNTILSVATRKGAIDPEAVYTMVREKAVMESGKVLIDGKEPEKAIEELLEKKPYLKKASPPGTGAPNTTSSQPQDYEELLKNPEKLLEVKRNNPELFERLKAEFLAKKLRR